MAVLRPDKSVILTNQAARAWAELNDKALPDHDYVDIESITANSKLAAAFGEAMDAALTGEQSAFCLPIVDKSGDVSYSTVLWLLFSTM